MVTKGSFKVDVYDCTVYIICCDHLLKSIRYHFKKHDEEPPDFEPAGYCYRPDNDKIGRYYVFIHNKYLSVNTVNHEKSHLVEFILEDRGIEPKDEVRSYLDGYISAEFERFFRRKGIVLTNRPGSQC